MRNPTPACRRAGVTRYSITPASRDTRRSLQTPLPLLKRQGKPGGESLHAVTFNVVTIPHRMRDRHRHSRLELGIVGITGFQRALHHHAPGWTSVSTTLDG